MTEDIHEEEFSIHWIEDVVQSVLERDEDEYLISTGKSPSGSIHIGIMREIIISDVIKRKILKMGKKARTMFVVDDYDPLRSLPPSVNLDLNEWAGIPYSDVPDPFGCCESFGAHWANELVASFNEFGVNPEVVYTSIIYTTSEMQKAVRICLQHTETIREIMIEYVAKDFNEKQKAMYIETMKTWYPASVVCPKCGRLQSGVKGEIRPNRITDYDSEKDLITFECHACGHSDTLPLDQVRVKLTWRIDWPAKWYVYHVSCEPAGKDHSVKGGSYDTGLEVSRRVFDWPGPVKVPYEWVRIGGRDMSTSEGIVFIPKTWLLIAPPELYRFLMLKTDLARAINIQPDRIPDMIDEYERFERTYYGLEDVDDERLMLSKTLYPLCVQNEVSEEYIPKLSFKFAVVLGQLKDVLGLDVVIEKCKEVMRKQYNISEIPKASMDLIPIRLERARNWVKMFGSTRDQIEVHEEIPDTILSTFKEEDKTFLRDFANALKNGPLDDEEIQAQIFETARNAGIKDRRAFIALYRLLISSKSGPRLGPFLNLLGLDWVIKRIERVL